MLKYKGYHGKVELDEDAGILHGEVLDLNDVITFQGRTVEEIQQAFQESVDDYLEFCAKRGEEPEKPFSGKLMLRLPKDVHRNVYLNAKKEGKSLNEYITQKLEQVGE
ncbi:MAG: type II toxin-antitoxin system HicB family antitoxin [bacterium]|nr:type II toxin-antitoxin system HicB family antitoxin [bacterium]